MKRTHTCGTCLHFRPGAHPDMSWPAPLDSDDELGVCEYREPTRHVRPIGPLTVVGMQPQVHASRCCQEYLPADEDGDDDGERAPGSTSNIHHLNAPRDAA